MKKIMGHVTGKLSLSILTLFVLLVGVLAGLDKVTTTKTSSNNTSTATPASPATTAKATTAASKIIPASSNPAAKALQAKDLTAAKEAAKTRSLAFEPNRGQSNKEVQYFARSAGYEVFVKSPATAVLQFRPTVDSTERVTMKLNGANEHAQAMPLEPNGNISNYHIGADQTKWVDGIPNYAKLRYNDVYPGIDVVYQGDGKNFRHDFVVKAGADPKAIHLSYEGAKGTRIDEQGRLVIALAKGSVAGSKPYIYQEYGGTKHEVAGGYVMTAQNEAAFELGAYDRSKELVIDPGYTYASYVITSADMFESQVTGVALNATNELFCGWTFSPKINAALTGGQQIAITSSAAISTLKSTATFVGGTTGNTQANGCALSKTGATVMVGVTNSGTTFSGTASSLLTPAATGVNFNKHGFIVASSPSISALIAGNGSDVANAVAFDASGNIHVVGATSSGSQGSPTNNLMTAMVTSCASTTLPLPTIAKPRRWSLNRRRAPTLITSLSKLAQSLTVRSSAASTWMKRTPWRPIRAAMLMWLATPLRGAAPSAGRTSRCSRRRLAPTASPSVASRRPTPPPARSRRIPSRTKA